MKLPELDDSLKRTLTAFSNRYARKNHISKEEAAETVHGLLRGIVGEKRGLLTTSAWQDSQRDRIRGMIVEEFRHLAEIIKFGEKQMDLFK